MYFNLFKEVTRLHLSWWQPSLGNNTDKSAHNISVCKTRPLRSWWWTEILPISGHIFKLVDKNAWKFAKLLWKSTSCSLILLFRNSFSPWGFLKEEQTRSCTCHRLRFPKLSSVYNVQRESNEKLTVASDWFLHVSLQANRCSSNNRNITEQDFLEGKSCSASKQGRRTHSSIRPNSCSVRPGQRHEKITSC